MQESLQELLEKYAHRAATPAEVEQLAAFLKAGAHDEAIKVMLERMAENTATDRTYSDDQLEAVIQKILHTGRAPVIPIRRKNYSTRIAAAVILLILGTGAYYLFQHRQHQEVAQVETPVPQDVAAPSSVHAVIRLANGQQIILDSAGNGTVATQGHVTIIKKASGQIEYKGKTDEVAYNTLVNPRGSRVVSLTLADGTRVWLNAASSLTYPTAFAGNERKVIITGEAYFEVTHNPAQPFIVSKNDMEVKVLGTHFNVNAYDDEPELKVTLLEGRVKVSLRQARGGGSVTIQPGQQVVSMNKGPLTINHSADLEQVMAWKNGNFKFKDTNIKEIMRQASRWYNVDIQYQGNFSDLNFGGSVSRQSHISELLKRLTATEAVHFTINGNKITVMH